MNNTAGSNPSEASDSMTVDFTIDGGASWLPLEIVDEAPDTEGGWYEASFILSDVNGFVESDQFQIRFAVADLNGGSVIEAGIDNIQISSVDCENSASCPTDLNGDGNSNLIDLLQVVSDFGCIDSCDSDVDGDGVVNLIDLLAIVSGFGPCP